MTVLAIYDHAAGVVTETVDGEKPVTYSLDEYQSIESARDRQAEIFAQEVEHEAYTVEPTNPYREPTHGPILAAYMCPRRGPPLPPEVRRLAATPGYGIMWHPVRHQARRRWSLEAIGRNRRRRLCKRLEARYPLFSEQWIEAALAADPERYYPERYPDKRAEEL